MNKVVIGMCFNGVLIDLRSVFWTVTMLLLISVAWTLSFGAGG